MRLRIFILSILLSLTQLAYLQNKSFYMRIVDESFVPIETRQVRGLEKVEVRTKSEKFNAVLSKYNIKRFSQAFPTAKSEWLRQVFIVESEAALLEYLERNEFAKEIMNIEPLGEPELLYTPNDYSLALSQTNLDLVKAKGAWDIIGNLPRIPIGVIDTYFKTDHEDLENQFIAISGSNTNIANYHGSAVAGLLGAITNNGKGIASISLGTKMYASTNTDLNLINSEVLRIAQLGYRVINCSWTLGCGYSHIDDSLYSEIKNTWNTVVVFGAGNNGGYRYCHGTSDKVYPASYPSVLSVTSVGHMHPAGYISPVHGPVGWIDCHEEVVGNLWSAHHHNDAVDICAPGYDVPIIRIDLSEQYGYDSGTSYATPQVAATACLVLSINPCLSAAQAIDIIKNTADASIYSLPCNAPFLGLLGSGRLDVEAASLMAAESATKTFSLPTTFSGNQVVETNYAIKTTAPTKIVSGANVLFKTRKEVVIDSEFEVELGATFEINVNPNNTINCN